VVLSLLAFGLLQNVEQRNLSLQADDAAATRTAALSEAIHDRLALEASARLIFDVSDEVTRPGFGEVDHALASAVGGLKALFFLRRVEASERPTFEEWRGHDLEGFQIRDLASTGGLVPAADRDVYFPVDFVEPSNAFAGLDAAGDPRCRKALDATADFNTIAGAVAPGAARRLECRAVRRRSRVPLAQRAAGSGGAAARAPRVRGDPDGRSTTC
jgi:CHASE1-domain containing sensor protein